MGIKQSLVGRYLAHLIKGSKATWRFLDGWKTWLVAIVLFTERICTGPSCGTSFGYVHSVLNALGLAGVTPEFDPAQAAVSWAFMVATGHRLLKAIQQWRAGVSLMDLHTVPSPPVQPDDEDR